MIYEVLNFLRQKLDAYLAEGRTNTEPIVVLSTPWTSNDNSKGTTFQNSISLINIEEEKVFKSQVQTVTRLENGAYYTKREPDVKLNLYLLLSAYNKSYEDALKFISRVVTYFQVNSVFNRDDQALNDLPDGVEKIIMELFTATFEQQNQIWASLSTGYIPSVIYKVKTLTIDAGQESEKQRSIKDIDIKTKYIQETE